MVKLSICIPYYDTYDLTVKLLDKLIQQKTNEVEIILIDDGCQEKRLDKYKNKITIKHLKENTGGATASNKALDLAQGEYVALIDSDDMVSDDYIDTLISCINEHKEDLMFMDWQDMDSGIIIRHPYNYAPWKCIYRRKIMPRFIDGWIYSYDVPFQQELDKLNLSKYYIDKVLYYYNSARPDNLTHKKAEYIRQQEQKND